jgi:TusA-related sulfurtransferase
MQVFKAAKEAVVGDVIHIKVTDRGFAKDIQAWCKKTGHELLELVDGDTEIQAKILRK